MARRRSRVKGAAHLRRTLRRIEPEQRVELGEALTQAGEALMAELVALTPQRSGGLVSLYDYRLDRAGLVLRVGLVTKAARRDGFYFRYLDIGTKGYPPRNIPPMRALRIRERALAANRDRILKAAADGMAIALERAARGGGRDE